jgi:cytochrome c oxidase subunit II
VKIPSSIWTLLIGILLTLVSLWYGQNHGLLPIAATDEADLMDGLFNTMMVVSTGIFLLVEGILIYSAIRYRRRPGDNEDGPPVEGNVPLEILWTAIPAIIVLGISVYSFDVYNEMGGFDPHAAHQAPIIQRSMKMPGAAMPGLGYAYAATLNDTQPSTEPNQNAPGVGIVAPTIGQLPEQEGKPPAMVVNVTAMQYAFIFTYPETDVTSGELHVPIGREVELNMSANDVIHAFWVPEFRLKQDIIPGRQTEVRFTPNKEGNYDLICAELCGPYHGAMRTQVIVEKQEAFDNWIQEQLVASTQTLNQAVAVNPTDISPDKFLAPYTKDMGIEPAILHQIHH